MTGRQLLVCLFLPLGALILLLPCVVPGLSEFFLLFTGWTLFLFRVVPQMAVDWGGLATALLCLAGASLALHYFCRWYYAQVQQRLGPDAASGPTPAKSWPWRWTFSLMALIVLLFLAGISAVGLTHQAVWLATSPEPLYESGIRTIAGRMQSANNLKQLGLAVHDYHELHKSLPPSPAFDPHGRPLHGWQTFLLPYLEQQSLFQKIDLAVAWDDSRNQAAFQQELSFFLQPMVEQRFRDGYALTHYAGNIGVWGTGRQLNLAKDFADGTSNTILAGEVAANFKPWGYPLNWRDPALGINQSPNGFGSLQNKRNGAQLLMADGTVRFFPADTSRAVLQAFSTPSGHDQEGVHFPD